MAWLEQEGAWLRRHAARRGRCHVVCFPKYLATTKAVEHSNPKPPALCSLPRLLSLRHSQSRSSSALP
uniref:Uncharacterized protein n=1 Tax=Arundo donax TaxID=35708 RepID=A0A0A9GD46_ARUDO